MFGIRHLPPSISVSFACRTSPFAPETCGIGGARTALGSFNMVQQRLFVLADCQEGADGRTIWPASVSTPAFPGITGLASTAADGRRRL